MIVRIKNKKFHSNCTQQKQKKQILILDFHHLSVAEIVPSLVLQPTPVLEINFFHILQSFFIPSHLFFNCAFVNACQVYFLKQFITYFQPALSKYVFNRIPFSIALIQMSQNMFNISLVQ